jgi:uncharacterized protein
MSDTTYSARELDIFVHPKETRVAQLDVGVMLDLHRGKASGIAWSLVIDGLCILIPLVTATGFFLWTSLRGRGHLGLWVLLLGVVVGVGVYWVWVP